MKSSREPRLWAQGTAEPSSLLPFSCRKKRKKEESHQAPGLCQGCPGGAPVAPPPLWSRHSQCSLPESKPGHQGHPGGFQGNQEI